MPSTNTPLNDQDIADLTFMLVFNCVQTTSLADVQASGGISAAEMKTINTEVTDRLYTALQYILNPLHDGDWDKFKDLLAHAYPEGWPRPDHNPELLPIESWLQKDQASFSRVKQS